MNCPNLTLKEAQAIAENIVGPVVWDDDAGSSERAEGTCRCPGAARHTGRDEPGDCKLQIVINPVEVNTVRVTCLHGAPCLMGCFATTLRIVMALEIREDALERGAK